MVSHFNTRRFLLLATLPLALGVTGCLDEVPLDEGDEQPTEEELAGDGQPEGSDNLIIESGIGVSGALNLFDDTGYSDTRQVRYSYDSDFGNDGFNDKASSLVNRTGYYWMLYHDKGYSGPRVCLRPYSRIYDLHDYWHRHSGGELHWWNDVISSVKKQGVSSTSCDGVSIIGER